MSENEPVSSSEVCQPGHALQREAIRPCGLVLSQILFDGQGGGPDRLRVVRVVAGSYLIGGRIQSIFSLPSVNPKIKLVESV